MKEVDYQGLWSIQLTDEQCEIGKIASTKPGATHYSVFAALKDAGVLVRNKDQYPASQAATALLDGGKIQ